MIAIIFASSMLLSSCYSYTSVVGSGAQGSAETTEWNHYILYGLVDVGTSDSKAMAGGADNYVVNVKHTFLQGLIQGITFGIYTPTLTTVTK